ncbi:MAG: histidinol-phosphatase [Kiritimatiellia bacterium]
MKRASYHNHTVFSDGADTPEAFYQNAKTQGVDILGFADHYYRASADAIDAPEWALQPHLEERYFNAIRDLQRHHEMEIRVGMEFDWLEGSAAWLMPVTQDPRLDYTIGSVHYVGADSIDSTRKFWEERSQEERDELFRNYWIAVREMAESRLFDIVGHVDLIKKFDFYPSEDITPFIREALDAIKASRMVVELNTSGWNKDCRESYPSEPILHACFHREIPVTVSSDAHRARFVCANFSRAFDLLTKVGYKHVARFTQRQVTFEPIDL